MDPTDPSRIVVVYQQDRFAVDGGALTNQYAVSSDGGRTFAGAPFPGLSRCTERRQGARERPVGRLRPDGVAYAANLTFDENPALGAAGLAGPTALSSQTSADGGKTWSAPATIVDQSIYDDREAITPDPRKKGVVYAAWVRRLGSFGETGTLQVSRSEDAGRTWSAGAAVYAPGPAKLPDPDPHRGPARRHAGGDLPGHRRQLRGGQRPQALRPAHHPLVRRRRDLVAPSKFGTTISTTPHDPDTGAEIRSLPIVATAVGATARCTWPGTRSSRRR